MKKKKNWERVRKQIKKRLRKTDDKKKEGKDGDCVWEKLKRSGLKEVEMEKSRENGHVNYKKEMEVGIYSI